MIEVNTVTDYRPYTENGKKGRDLEKNEAEFTGFMRGLNIRSEKDDSKMNGDKTGDSERSVSFSGTDFMFYDFAGQKSSSGRFTGRLINIEV